MAFKHIVASPEKVRLVHFGDKFRLVREAAAEAGARAAINFQYFAMSPVHPIGSYPVGQLMIRGENKVLSQNIDHFHGFYRRDGKLAVWQWLPNGCEWGVRAGPRLVTAGKICESAPYGGGVDDPRWPAGGVSLTASKPRVAVGLRADGQAVLAYWDAVTMRQAAEDMLSVGCVDAVAGDGGGSASWYDSQHPEDTVSQRLVSMCLIVEGDAKPAPRKVDLDLSDRQLTENFRLHEFQCQCGCGRLVLSPAFVELVACLQKLREMVGRPVHVTSGNRCPKHDAAVGSSANPGQGPHVYGYAADIWWEGATVDQMAEAARKCGFRGIGRYYGQHFVHVDMRETPGEWVC